MYVVYTLKILVWYAVYSLLIVFSFFFLQKFYNSSQLNYKINWLHSEQEQEMTKTLSCRITMIISVNNNNINSSLFIKKYFCTIQ